LLTVDIDMEPMSGFNLANWEKGFGDFELRPDFATLRALPWQEGSALVICDFAHHDGRLVEEAPRTALKRQLENLAKKRLACNIASELEFYLFNHTYHEAFVADYRELSPSSDYRIDYHTMQTLRDEPLFRSIAISCGLRECPLKTAKANGDAASTRST